ncbi:hypothetical protein C8Q70DRAFT_212700 [Cubamyces menziesii]|nr:hypothetical protein C8Q70DRAFT_212700 [Cubamyces menziesii]
MATICSRLIASPLASCYASVPCVSLLLTVALSLSTVSKSSTSHTLRVLHWHNRIGAMVWNSMDRGTQKRKGRDRR